MSQDPSVSQRRRFTYGEARALLPEVRSLTERAYRAVEELQLEMTAQPESEELHARLEEAVRDWAERLVALGVEVKGVWLVDFDNGSGYYCWRWPEADLEFYHSYEDGFGGRVRIPLTRIIPEGRASLRGNDPLQSRQGAREANRSGGGGGSRNSSRRGSG